MDRNMASIHEPFTSAPRHNTSQSNKPKPKHVTFEEPQRDINTDKDPRSKQLAKLTTISEEHFQRFTRTEVDRMSSEERKVLMLKQNNTMHDLVRRIGDLTDKASSSRAIDPSPRVVGALRAGRDRSSSMHPSELHQRSASSRRVYTPVLTDGRDVGTSKEI